MRVITLNLNGVRSAANKGFFQWMPQQQADIVCVQELKAQLNDMTTEMKIPNGYQGYFHCSDKKGYSGVGVYSRHAPDKIIEGIGIPEIDFEGRYLRADFGNLSIISIYLPSGASGEHRQAIKFFFMKRFFPILQALARSGREFILCGDWNIAHKEIDLKNWRANAKKTMWERFSSGSVLAMPTKAIVIMVCESNNQARRRPSHRVKSGRGRRSTKGDHIHLKP